VINPSHYLKEFHIKYNPKANELAVAGKRDFGTNSWATSAALA